MARMPQPNRFYCILWHFTLALNIFHCGILLLNYYHVCVDPNTHTPHTPQCTNATRRGRPDPPTQSNAHCDHLINAALITISNISVCTFKLFNSHFWQLWAAGGRRGSATKAIKKYSWNKKSKLAAAVEI